MFKSVLLSSIASAVVLTFAGAASAGPSDELVAAAK